MLPDDEDTSANTATATTSFIPLEDQISAILSRHAGSPIKVVPIESVEDAYSAYDEATSPSPLVGPVVNMSDQAEEKKRIALALLQRTTFFMNELYKCHAELYSHLTSNTVDTPTPPPLLASPPMLSPTAMIRTAFDTLAVTSPTSPPLPLAEHTPPSNRRKPVKRKSDTNINAPKKNTDSDDDEGGVPIFDVDAEILALRNRIVSTATHVNPEDVIVVIKTQNGETFKKNHNTQVAVTWANGHVTGEVVSGLRASKTIAMSSRAQVPRDIAKALRHLPQI
jgi:hypothetical protein